MLLRIGRRRDQGVGVQETMDRSQGNDSTLRDMPAMVKMNRTGTTKELGQTGITSTRKLLTHGIRRDNSGWDGRGVVALQHTVAKGVLSRDTEVADSNRGVIMIIGNTKNGSPATGVKRSNMPQEIKTIGSTSHGATIHMGMSRGGGTKRCFLCTELLIELGPGDLHLTELKVKSIQGTGTRVQSVNVGVKKGHVRIRKGGTVDAANRMGGRINGVTVNITIIEEVKVKDGIGGRGQGQRVNKTTSSKVSILHQIRVKAVKIDIIKLKQEIGCRKPEIGGGRQL
jgi:hypothetical protein